MECPYPLTEEWLSENESFRYMHDISCALFSAYYMPWRGARRLWHQFVIKLITAWNSYYAATQWPFGQMMSIELLTTFRRQLDGQCPAHAEIACV